MIGRGTAASKVLGKVFERRTGLAAGNTGSDLGRVLLESYLVLSEPPFLLL